MAATPTRGKSDKRECYAEILGEKHFITTLKPDDDAVAALLNIARSCGLSSKNGMSVMPIEWTEIKAWQELTFNQGAWLASAVVFISIAYVNGYHEFNDKPYTLSPLDPRTEEIKARQEKYKDG